MRGETLTPSDVALLSGRNNNDGGFGEGSGAWLIILFLIFAAFGWGNNGYGNRGGNGSNGSSGAADNYVLASDFATVERQLDNGFDRVGDRINAVYSGLCDGFYAINTSFGNLNTNLCNQFANVSNAITQNGYETRLATQNLGSQLADCCCKTQASIADVNYNLATNACAINNNITAGTNAIQNSMCTNTRDIVDAVNSSYRSLHDEIVANRIEDKNAQITAQQNEINALRLAASQQAQNTYLVNELRPSPVPAYITCNPYSSCGYGYGSCSGCGTY